MVLHERVTKAALGVHPEWAPIGPERKAHIERVAALMEEWADRADLDDEDRARWRAAAFLHDALREVDPQELRIGLPESYHGLPGPVLHGPAAAERLRREGVTDESLLGAVAWHTLGHPALDRLGRALYAADFLDPGRPFLQEWREELRHRMHSEPEAVIREIVAARIRHLLDRDLPLPGPTVGLWNAVSATPAAP